MPPGLTLTLVIEGHQIVLNDKALTLSKRATTPPGRHGVHAGRSRAAASTTSWRDNSPQIMLFSNGDTNSFALTIVRDGVSRSVTLQSSADGTIKVGDIMEPKR